MLVWGGAGGLGSMAIQIVREFGGRPVAVVSSDDKAEFCRKLGAVGVINRREFERRRIDGVIVMNAGRAERIAGSDPYTKAGFCAFELFEWEVHQVLGVGPFTAAELRAHR